MANRLARSLSYGLMVPAAFSLAACGGQASTAEQQPAPQVEIKRATIVSLFESAFVGTPEKPGCLWGKAYDTDLHLDDTGLLPTGFQPAIPRVTGNVTSGTSASMFIVPRGNDAEWIELDVKYSEGNVSFIGTNTVSNDTLDRLSSLSCKKMISVPYQP